MLHRKRLQASAALAALTIASACAVSDTTYISRSAQLDAALAAFPDTECTYTVISANLAGNVMDQPDGASVLASLSQACPGIRVGLREEDASFRTSSGFANDGLTQTADGGTSAGGAGSTGESGGSGGTGGDSSAGGSGSSAGGSGGGTGEGGGSGGGAGDSGGAGAGDSGNNGGGKGGGSKGNNGGGNGGEGSSPGKGGGANNDE